MPRSADDTASTDPFFSGEDPLLDLDAVDAFEPPRRLTRDEGRRAAGPDWFRTRLNLNEEFADD